MGYPAKTKRNLQMLQLHQKGIEYREIGRRFGISHQAVQCALKRAYPERLTWRKFTYKLDY